MRTTAQGSVVRVKGLSPRACLCMERACWQSAEQARSESYPFAALVAPVARCAAAPDSPQTRLDTVDIDER